MAIDFTQLRIWQSAHELALKIYKISKEFPKEEIYGLTSQVRRAAVSVELNIAEGHSRFHKLEEARFLTISNGSATEVQSCLLLARDLNYCSPEISSKLFSEYTSLIKQTNSLIKYKKASKKSEKIQPLTSSL